MTQELLRRIDALDGCQGHWVLLEDNEPSRIWWEQSYEDLFQRCIDNGWRELSLAFVPSWFGYSDYGNTGLVALTIHTVQFTRSDMDTMAAALPWTSGS